MARIFPIKGIMYDTQLKNELGKFLCPPFDVINDNDKNALYKTSDYNVIRLENGKTLSSDNESNNKYTRAAEYLSQWLKKGILKKEKEESFFILQEIFEINNSNIQRNSLICNVKVENYESKIVFPHEKTREKQKQDRLDLMKATGAVFSPIMSMIEDKDKKLNQMIKNEIKSTPLISGEIPFMHKFNLWKIDDADKINLISSIFENEKIFIADGHHRYETAINYKNFDPNSDKRMMNIFSSCDDGLLLFGYSRAIKNLDAEKLDKLIVNIFDKFTTKEIDWDESILNWNQSVEQTIIMGLNDKHYYLNKENELISTYEKLHGIFEELLGDKVLDHIEYIHDNEILKEKSKNNEIQISFYMNALSKNYFLDCVSEGKLLPPKSTLFFPKLPTGLVIQYLDE